MKGLLRQIRRLVRFVLACLLWLNALFIFRVPAPSTHPLATWLHITPVEAVLLVLLAALSLLTRTGYGQLILDLLYIYAFPFILLFLLVVAICKGLFRLYRLVVATDEKPDAALPNVVTTSIVPDPPKAISLIESAPKRSEEIWAALINPFRRFTLLWCFLSALATTPVVLKISFVVVSIHVLKTVVTMLRFTVFSQGVIWRFEKYITNHADNVLAKISIVTRESEPTSDLRNLWAAVTALKTGVGLLKNRTLVARWALFLTSIFLGAAYVYISLLFSFVYYGMGRLLHVNPFGWGEALVTSLFIPFAFGDLPHNVWIKLVGGLHCSFVVLVGAGTVFNYIRKRIDSISSTATVLSVRFSDEAIQSKLIILDEKFGKTNEAGKPK